MLETDCLVPRIRPVATNPSIPLVKMAKLLWTATSSRLAWRESRAYQRALAAG